MTPTSQTGLLATVGLAALAQALACALLGFRIRHLAARLDAQRVELEASRAQIAALEARLAQRERELDRQRPPRSAQPTAEAKRLHRHDRRQVALAEGPVLIAVPSLATSGSTTPSEAAAEFDRRFGPIWALAETTASLDEIARQTGYPVGQVELILGLRGPRPHGPRPGDGPADPQRGAPDA